ncbi:unnamed protein product, partial [Ixodes pacificus]
APVCAADPRGGLERGESRRPSAHGPGVRLRRDPGGVAGEVGSAAPYAKNYHVANLLVQVPRLQLTVPVVQDQTWTLLTEFGLSRSGHSLSAHVCFSLREIEFDHRRMYIF